MKIKTLKRIDPPTVHNIKAMTNSCVLLESFFSFRGSDAVGWSLGAAPTFSPLRLLDSQYGCN